MMNNTQVQSLPQKRLRRHIFDTPLHSHIMQSVGRW